MSAFSLMLSVLVLLGCAAEQARQQPSRVDGKLVRNAQGVYFESSNASLRLADTALPYAAVSTEAPALVTVVGNDLSPTTWALGGAGEITSYAGYLPLLCNGSLTALLAIPQGETDGNPGLVLLDRQGAEYFSSGNAQLLVPAEGVVDSESAYIATGGPAGILATYDSDLVIIKLDARTGDEQWRVEPQLDYPAIEVEYWLAQTGYGVFSVQYGQQRFDFMLIDLADGTVIDTFNLNGQPFYGIVFPGSLSEPVLERSSTDKPAIRFFPLSGPPEYLLIDPATALFTTEPAPYPIPQPIREENPASELEQGTPGPPTPPLPQTILPTATTGEFSIPALRNARGDVLVIDQAGARWVAIELPN